MPNYFYTAKSLKGEKISGEREANNKKELAKILRQEGFILIKANPLKPPTKFWWGTLSFLERVSLKEKIMFTRNLKVMISAGVSLPSALDTLAFQSKNKKFDKVLLDIRNKIIEGKTFSEGIKKYSNIFPPFYYHLIKIGEESGTLEKSLENLISQMEKEYELKSNIKGALMYPTVIILAMIAILILMLLVIIPGLAETFTQMGVELPFATKLIIESSLFLAERWYLLILIVIALFLLGWWMIKAKGGKKTADWLSLRIPIVSPIMKKSNSAYIIRALATLIDSGLPILQSLSVISEASENFYFKESLENTARKVEKGQKISEGLGVYSDLYSHMVIQMIRVGEETGQTSMILKKTADFLEAEITKTTQNLSQILEPILIIIIGGAVGFLAISIIQPIYSMMGAI